MNEFPAARWLKFDKEERDAIRRGLTMGTATLKAQALLVELEQFEEMAAGLEPLARDRTPHPGDQPAIRPPALTPVKERHTLSKEDMPQNRYERHEGESEADFSLRMAKIQREEREAGRLEMESEPALVKAGRVWGGDAA